jgi:hypothetical protein
MELAQHPRVALGVQREGQWKAAPAPGAVVPSAWGVLVAIHHVVGEREDGGIADGRE